MEKAGRGSAGACAQRASRTSPTEHGQRPLSGGVGKRRAHRGLRGRCFYRISVSRGPRQCVLGHHGHGCAPRESARLRSADRPAALAFGAFAAHRGLLPRWALAASGATLGLALASTLGAALVRGAAPGLGVRVDAVTCVMLLLVCSVGHVIVRYSRGQRERGGRTAQRDRGAGGARTTRNPGPRQHLVRPGAPQHAAGALSSPQPSGALVSPRVSARRMKATECSS